MNPKAATSSGVAFTAPGDGDMRGDLAARRRAAQRLGIPASWATADQVHGRSAVLVEGAGVAGEGDGLVTTIPDLPVAIFTADCLGVVLTAPAAAGVAHAGWRGLSAGILEATAGLMVEAGSAPMAAHLGPAIGPCCFEVGEEVAELFPEDVSTTAWGSTSVDLVSAARRRLHPLPVVAEGRCTACQGGPSHRSTATAVRMAAVGWLP